MFSFCYICKVETTRFHQVIDGQLCRVAACLQCGAFETERVEN